MLTWPTKSHWKCKSRPWANGVIQLALFSTLNILIALLRSANNELTDCLNFFQTCLIKFEIPKSQLKHFTRVRMFMVSTHCCRRNGSCPHLTLPTTRIDGRCGLEVEMRGVAQLFCTHKVSLQVIMRCVPEIWMGVLKKGTQHQQHGWD